MDPIRQAGPLIKPVQKRHVQYIAVQKEDFLTGLNWSELTLISMDRAGNEEFQNLIDRALAGILLLFMAVAKDDALSFANYMS